MLRTKSFISLCSRAKDCGLSPSFSVGDVIARGFADLGAELFEILPGDKIMSLYTGKVAALTREDRDRFFAIPGVDEVADRIERAGDGVMSISQLSSRDWRVMLKSGVYHESGTIEEALLGAYVLVVSNRK